MNQIVLYQPEIPPNTGNIARTCAATGTALSLIEPLGFSLEDRYMRRAGLDYWEDLTLNIFPGWEPFVTSLDLRDGRPGDGGTRIALLSTRGVRRYTEIPADQPVALVFGPETRGLPADLLARHREDSYRIPMKPGQRSLNLANTAALILYDLLRRQGFPGLE